MLGAAEVLANTRERRNQMTVKHVWAANRTALSVRCRNRRHIPGFMVIVTSVLYGVEVPISKVVVQAP